MKAWSKAYHLTPAQKQKVQENELEARKRAEADHKEATLMYKNEQTKVKGLSSQKVIDIVNKNMELLVWLHHSSMKRFKKIKPVLLHLEEDQRREYAWMLLNHYVVVSGHTFCYYKLKRWKKKKQERACSYYKCCHECKQRHWQKERGQQRIEREMTNTMTKGSQWNAEARCNKPTMYDSLNQWLDFMSN